MSQPVWLCTIWNDQVDPYLRWLLQELATREGRDFHDPGEEALWREPYKTWNEHRGASKVSASADFAKQLHASGLLHIPGGGYTYGQGPHPPDHIKNMVFL